jgi:hypothetical protein
MIMQVAPAQCAPPAALGELLLLLLLPVAMLHDEQLIRVTSHFTALCAFNTQPLT